jgi:hypothetical protein
MEHRPNLIGDLLRVGLLFRLKLIYLYHLGASPDTLYLAWCGGGALFFCRIDYFYLKDYLFKPGEQSIVQCRQKTKT